MAVDPRFWAVLLCGAAACAGLALGAATQKEQFLSPTVEDTRGATGNLIPVTGLLVGLAAGTGAFLLAQRRAWPRLGWSAVLAAAVYGLVQLLQTYLPNYTVLDLYGADLAVSLLASDLPAVPSLVTPVFALFWAGLAASAAAIGGLGGPPRLRSSPEAGAGLHIVHPHTAHLPAVHLHTVHAHATGPDRRPQPQPPRPALEALRRRHAGLLLAATPFLAVNAIGLTWILVHLPSGSAKTVGYLVLLPVAVLGLAGVLAVEAWKAWHLASAVREPRLRPVALEAWLAAGRAAPILMGAVAAAAAAAALLPALPLPELTQGRTFGASLRSQTQFQLFALLPAVPLLLLHRPGIRALAEHASPGAPLRGGAWLVPAAVAAATAAAAAAAWGSDRALLPWLVAFLVLAVPALLQAGPRGGPLVLLLGAFAAWGVGNTIVAALRGPAAFILEFETGPGELALWRMLAAALAGVALARGALALPGGGRPDRRAAAVALATGLAVCIMGVAMAELSLHAWMVSRPEGQAIAVGSLPASQEGSGRILLEGLALALSVAAAAMAARLWRPDWFRKPGRGRHVTAAHAPAGAASAVRRPKALSGPRAVRAP